MSNCNIIQNLNIDQDPNMHLPVVLLMGSFLSRKLYCNIAHKTSCRIPVDDHIWCCVIH